MFTTPEQISAASKATIESQVSLFLSLANKTFEGVEKLVDLNINTVKASMEESNAAAQQLFSVKDPQEWLSVTASLAQPSPEKLVAYSRQLATIASNVQAEFTKAAEVQVSEAGRKVLDLIDELTKNAPAGTENIVTFMKSAIGNASAGYEQLSKTTKQAADTIGANLNSAVTTAVTELTQPVAKAARAAGAKK